MMSHRRLLLSAAAASLALAGCNQQPAAPATGAPIASLPLAQGAPPPEAAAPYADALPAAPPLPRVARPRRPVYAYVDDAYELADAFADSPPDYTVDYDGVRPYVWRSRAGEYRVVEETPDGEREYFYRGDSDYPFLIRDNNYAYAYDDGELVEVYDSYGRPYPNYDVSAAEIAARYLYRARHLYDAALHQQRQAVYASDWRARRDTVLAPEQVWAVERERNPDWRRIHDEHMQRAAPQQLAAMQQERAQRQAYAVRTAPMIAAAPPAPRREFARGPAPEPAAVERGGAEAFGRQPEVLGAQGRVPPQPLPPQVQGRQEAQAQAAARAQFEAQRQRGPAFAGDRRGAEAEAGGRPPEPAQAQAQFRDQQRAQFEAQRQAGMQQAREQQRAQVQAQAQVANRARDEGQRQAQMQQPREQQRAQAQAADRARDEGQRQAQMQARAQAEAAGRARDEGQRQAQMQQAREQQRAQAEAGRQAQAQAAAQQRQMQAQQHQQQAQAQAQRQQQAQAQAQAQRQQQAQHQQQAQAAAAQHGGGRPPGKDDGKDHQK